MKDYALIDTNKVFEKSKILKKILKPLADHILKKFSFIQFITKNQELELFPFIEKILSFLKSDFILKTFRLKEIEKGPLVIVANHPTGFHEFFLFIKWLFPIRQDVKFIANQYLNLIPNHQKYLIPVDTENPLSRINKQAYLTALKTLENKGVVVVFPSGKISNKKNNTLIDTPWSLMPVKLAFKTKAKILGVFFDVENPSWFYKLQKVSRTLALYCVPEIFFRYQRNKISSIYTTDLINPHDPKKIPFEQQTKFLQSLVFSLKDGCKYENTKTCCNYNIPVLEPIAPEELKQAFERSDPKLLTEQANLQAFLIEGPKIDEQLLNEIGILRELSFRKVLQGENKPVDLSKEDLKGYHVIVWDKIKNQINAGFRFSYFGQIIEKSYLASTYDIKLDQSLKFLNLADFKCFFAREDSNQKLLAISLIWSCLNLAYKNMKSFPDYLIGTTQISFNNYSKLSVDAMIYYHQLHGKNKDVWQKSFIAKNPYKISTILTQSMKQAIENCCSLRDLKTILSSWESENIQLPQIMELYNNMGSLFINPFYTGIDNAIALTTIFKMSQR
jgi:hypothetical protein